MNIADIVDQLKTERDRLDAAINAIETIGGMGSAAPRRGRLPGSKNRTTMGKPTQRRRLSAEARKRIAEAQRKRWAAVRAKRN
jgi:hypothetical protein